MSLELVTAALGGLTAILVGPGPWWVAHWRFLHQIPRPAVALWQAGTVAAIVAVVIAGSTAGEALVIMIGDRAAGLTDTAADWAMLVFDGLVVIFAAVVVLRLSWSVITVARQTSLRRTRHRAAVDLLGQIDQSSLPGLRVLTGAIPVAYCLPSLRDSRVVLSAGALKALAESELRAVLAHEEAHIRARHDLVLDTFTALHRAFPHLARSETPARQCTLLVEMLADDAAVRRTGPLPLARALVTLAGAPVPDTALGAAQTGVTERIARLPGSTLQAPRLWAGGIYLLAVGLVLSPILLRIGCGFLG